MKNVDFELRCCTCGYDLRGRSALGRCSECGTTVGATINATSLHERSIGRLTDSFVGGSSRAMFISALAIVTIATLLLAMRNLDSIKEATLLFFLIAWAFAAAWAVGRFTAVLTDAPPWWRKAITAEVLVVLLFTIAVLQVGQVWPRGNSSRASAVCVALPALIMPAILGMEPGEAWRQRLVVALLQLPPAIAIARGQ